MNRKDYLELAIERGYKGREDGAVWMPGKKNWSFGNKSNCGYHKFSLSVNGRSVGIKIHRFQAFLKFGDEIFKKELVVRHLNGNPIDNSWKNLELGTHQENMMDIPAKDRLEHSVLAAGKKRKFTDAEVVEIKRFYESARSYTQTMLKFGIPSKGSLYYILKKDYKTSK